MLSQGQDIHNMYYSVYIMDSEIFCTKCQQALCLYFQNGVYLINVAKCKFDPNKTIMHDLSSSNLLNLVYNLFLLTATLVKSLL